MLCTAVDDYLPVIAQVVDIASLDVLGHEFELQVVFEVALAEQRQEHLLRARHMAFVLSRLGHNFDQALELLLNHFRCKRWPKQLRDLLHEFFNVLHAQYGSLILLHQFFNAIQTQYGSLIRLHQFFNAVQAHYGSLIRPHQFFNVVLAQYGSLIRLLLLVASL